jgi:hypothetical protein
MLIEMAIPMRGQQRSPQIGLVMDTTLGRNLLNSFLAEPYWRVLESQLGTDIATQLMPSSLRSIAEKDVMALRRHDAAGIAWVELRAVIGDQPIYADFWDAFRDAILQTDFVRLVSDNRRIGVLAFSTACFQVVHTRDAELRTKLADDLVGICGALARTDRGSDRSDDDESPDLAWSVFEAALNLAIGTHGVLPDVVAEFERLFILVFDAWPAANALLGPGLMRLCRDLPPNITRELWPLIVRSRAEIVSA